MNQAYLVACPYCLAPVGRACRYIGKRDGKQKYILAHLTRRNLADRHLAEMHNPITDADLDQKVEERIASLSEWLSENAPQCGDEQAHLDEGAPERAYWHHGYLTALRDLQRVLRGKPTTKLC